MGESSWTWAAPLGLDKPLLNRNGPSSTEGVLSVKSFLPGQVYLCWQTGAHSAPFAFKSWMHWQTSLSPLSPCAVKINGCTLRWQSAIAWSHIYLPVDRAASEQTLIRKASVLKFCQEYSFMLGTNLHNYWAIFCLRITWSILIFSKLVCCHCLVSVASRTGVIRRNFNQSLLGD